MPDMDIGIGASSNIPFAGIAGVSARTVSGSEAGPAGIAVDSYTPGKELPQKKPFIIGHRGASSLAPENTLASFRKAHDLGAEMIELDVHRTKDGHLVIMHDDTVDRTTGSHGAVKDLTLEEIRQLDAGSWFSPEFKGEKVPTFDEVLEWAKGKVKIDIEIKNSVQYPGIEKDIIDRLKAMNMDRDVIITSFDPSCVKNVKSIDAEIKTGVLLKPDPLVKSLKIGTSAGFVTGLAGGILAGLHPAVTAAVTVAGGLIGFFASKEIGKKLSLKDSQDKGADIILPYWATLDKQWVQDMHAQGTMVFAYTADKPKLVHKLLDYYGVDGIITNNPERFVSEE
jgi:glycerophosphoryl diester phosphodiesterase